MRKRQLTAIRSRERGVALLAAMLLLVVAASYALLSKLNAAASIAYQQQRSARALAEAKSALVGYAMTYAENHPGQPQGYLPCPDRNGDGSADACLAATGSSVIGRLPWRTLGIEPLRDGNGECLWYAVSGGYRAAATKAPLSSDTDGLFEVQDVSGNVIAGATAASRAVALVFAPGSVLPNQDRSATGNRNECGSDNPADAIHNAANYLETINGVNNANGLGPSGLAMPTLSMSQFVVSPVVKISDATVFNDIIEAVTPSELIPVYRRMDQWVAARIRSCLIDYATASAGRYPWASALDPAAAPDYDDDLNARFGRIPDNMDDTVASAAAIPIAMSPTWSDDSVATAQGVFGADARCFNDAATQIAWSWWWWAGWRESVFYAVDTDFSPDLGATATTPLTLSVDLATANSQAAVLVAGRKLGVQTRTTNAERADIANYLEDDGIYDNRPGGSPGTGAIPPGNEAFGNAAVSATFNDVVCNQLGC